MKKVLSVAEWIIVLFLILGGISMFFVDPVVPAGPVQEVIGSKGAAITYGVIFITAGVGLAYGKIKKNIKAIKIFLMSAYLLAVFVFIIELLLLGWTVYLLDEIFFGMIAAWAWLRLKIDTEYITYEQLEELDRQGKLDES